MPVTTTRRTAKRRTALAGAALAVTALTAAVTPPTAPATKSLDVQLAGGEFPFYTIGPLGGLITPLVDALGYNPFPLPYNGVVWDFSGGAPTTRSIYDLFNGQDYTTPASTYPTCGGVTQKGCRTSFAISTGIGAWGLTDSIYALIESAEGKTREGFDPLKPNPGGTGITQVSPIYLNNVLRPNGGLASRFPAITELFGINPAMPPSGEFGPSADRASVFSWITDITWPYNFHSDFPITANPLSIANALFAAIPPPQLIGQITSAPSVGEALVNVFAATAGTIATSDASLAISVPPEGQCKNCGWASVGAQLLGEALSGLLPAQLPVQYVTLAAENPEIPLTYPMLITSALINPLLKAINSPYLLGTPEADVLTPMLKILVNVGYDDVITPDELNTVNPNNFNGYTYAKEGYTAYDRTFAQLTPLEPTPFAWFNNPGMTAEQTAAVPGDAWNAFTGALKAQTEKPLWGILVPNPDNPPAETAAAVAAPAPAAAVAESAPVIEEATAVDVAAVVDEDPAPVAVASDEDIVDEPATTSAAAALKSAPAGAAAGDDSGGNTGRAARHGGRGAD